MTRKLLWLLIARLDRADVALALPTVAWMAEAAGALFECYLESPRDGRLFARTGSTILGGDHHQQFNYLAAAFDVRYILLGETAVFDSSIAAFERPVISRADDLVDLYRELLKACPAKPRAAVFAPTAPLETPAGPLDLRPYLFPDIFFARAIALPIDTQPDGINLSKHKSLYAAADAEDVIDSVLADDDYGSITLRIAERWRHEARGVAFGDPAMILSQIPDHCRNRRVAVYAPREPIAPRDVKVSAYTEETSAIAGEVARLAKQIGNRVIVGRQTGDGDIFEWSRSGVCIQIADPNRPPFPVVAESAHPWTAREADPAADEPDDETLRQWADEGKVLSSMIWHSGEMAHNEAMVNLVDLASFAGVKMGIGVHAARYETCPQMWELLSIPREAGGVRGLVEPLLHSGGMGVMAEFNSPADRLGEHCREALSRIETIAGPANRPRGYYAFMDSDLGTLTQIRPELYESIAGAGLEYVISSASPGRNRILSHGDDCIVLNQTPRAICSASPFVRVSTVEELRETAPRVNPGWLLCALDAPVIAFDPYIWRAGSRFMKLVDYLTGGGFVNVLPRTIARYARVLRDRGALPPSPEGHRPECDAEAT